MQHRLIYTIEDIPLARLESMPPMPPPIQPIPAGAIDLQTVIHMLETDREWLRQVTPALTDDEFRDGIGIDLPDDIMRHVAQQFSNQEVAAPPPPKRATAADIEERTACRRFRKMETTPFQQTTCPICLADFRSNQKIVRLRGCSHDFHKNCITQWLTREKASCPVCKKDL